jgi:hypothetical protein
MRHPEAIGRDGYPRFVIDSQYGKSVHVVSFPELVRQLELHSPVRRVRKIEVVQVGPTQRLQESTAKRTGIE